MSTFTIMATKANPDRAAAAGMNPGSFQVSHWMKGEDGLPVNLHKLDAWLPSMEDAVQWVANRYPRAYVTKIRTGPDGKQVVVSYEAPMSELPK